MKQIALLGATGSIGDSTLDVVRGYPDRFRIAYLCGGKNVDKLAAAIREFKPPMAAICDATLVPELQKKTEGSGCTILGGENGILTGIKDCGANICVSAIVGSAGLKPTLAAIDCGMDIALANKETLVAAGSIVTERVKQKNVQLLPVDSEHGAALQCLLSGKAEEVESLILTASGGPFFGKSREELAQMKPADALAHPTWSMGQKISIDSATLANKALEVIEAHWLFNLSFDKIDVMIHRQSLVHAMIQYQDGSLMAQLAHPDMRLPIQYALGFPARLPLDLPRIGLQELSSMTFHEPNRNAFPLLELGYEAGRSGGVVPAIYSAANEEAVHLFLTERIGFNTISDAVAIAIGQAETIQNPDLETILAAETRARQTIQRRYI